MMFSVVMILKREILHFGTSRLYWLGVAFLYVVTISSALNLSIGGEYSILLGNAVLYVVPFYLLLFVSALAILTFRELDGRKRLRTLSHSIPCSPMLIFFGKTVAVFLGAVFALVIILICSVLFDFSQSAQFKPPNGISLSVLVLVAFTQTSVSITVARFCNWISASIVCFLSSIWILGGFLLDHGLGSGAITKMSWISPNLGLTYAYSRMGFVDFNGVILAVVIMSASFAAFILLDNIYE